MKEFWTTIQFVFAGIGGWLGYFLGGCDGLLYALIAFTVVDYITGVMCAIADKNLSSSVGFKGICRKVLIFTLVGIANILDVSVIGTGWSSSTTEQKTQKARTNNMKLVESILTKNPCYKAGKKITVKGLMLHSVGCPQPSAAVFIKNWNSESYDRACVHGFIDGNDGTVYQTLPWNHRGWHGGGSSNNTHIGVEMCEPACIKYTGGATFTCSDTATAKAVAKRTYEAAVELFAYLCKEYSLDPTADGVIVSHAEGYKRGIASNHGDPEHLWKQLNTGYTMDGFRKAVKAAMGTEAAQPESGTPSYPEKLTSSYYRVRKTWKDSKSQLGAYRVLANAKAKADENTGYSVFDNDGNVVYTPSAAKTETKTETAAFEPYRVRIGIANLNIRKGPGTNYGKTGQFTGVGVFTIIAESDGEGATKWGKLKSGAGWISLDYAKII